MAGSTPKAHVDPVRIALSNAVVHQAVDHDSGAGVFYGAGNGSDFLRLVYWIVKPQRTSSEISMASFPGKPDEVDLP